MAAARRKLEFNLYNAKNMSVFLDIFILLDTVRIIVSGGIKTAAARPRHYHTGDTQHFVALRKPQPVASTENS